MQAACRRSGRVSVRKHWGRGEVRSQGGAKLRNFLYSAPHQDQ